MIERVILEKALGNSLKRYLPPAAVSVISEWLLKYNAALKITKARKTKLGDYRAPFNGHGHRISINGNLNKYSFLITLVHEIAHLTTWVRFKHKVKPHGKEWKQEFQLHMQPFMNAEFFPTELLQALQRYMENPKASSCIDADLYKTLHRYDKTEDGAVFLEELPENATFFLNENRMFLKGKKLRKRFKCQEVASKKFYLVNPLARVVFVNK